MDNKIVLRVTLSDTRKKGEDVPDDERTVMSEIRSHLLDVYPKAEVCVTPDRFEARNGKDK